MAKERIGILGGAFDPVHVGHIQMALSTLDAVSLDQILIMPTGNPAYKNCTACAEDRWKMTVTACSQDPRLVPSRLELDRQGAIYTVDTLLALRRSHPKAELFYIIGADVLMKLEDWHRAEEVFPLCTFLVLSRPGLTDSEDMKAEKKRLKTLGAQIRTLKITPPVSISSTELRVSLREGLPTPELHVAVREFCECKGLYGAQKRVENASAWVDQLFDALDAHRFAHSLSVAVTARNLARIHGLDQKKAEEAGLLHDCAKCIPLKEMRKLAADNGLTEDETILESGALLHSLAGAWVAEHRYQMQDPEVLEAIRYHNTGHAGMSPLAMCVCLADSIEPLREDYPYLTEVRRLAGVSLERALLLSLERTAEYVEARGKYLHPRTRETIAWLKTLPACASGDSLSR